MKETVFIIAMLTFPLIWSQVNTEAMRKENQSAEVNHNIALDFSYFSGGSEIIQLMGSYRMDYLLNSTWYGFINGYYLGNLSGSTYEKITYFQETNFIIGICIFLIGLYINLKSDNILLRIKKENKGYQIPKGFLYNYISCPNYFGEIIEWLGFALMVWSLPAFIFVLWTMFNLIPRAVSHHKWYRGKFPDYPTLRKAVIPFIL